MGFVDELYEKYPIRTEIYIELKKILEKEFNIEPYLFLGIILKDIDVLFKTGLDHLDVFIETDLDKIKLNINSQV
jgi:hypothetical protein